MSLTKKKKHIINITILSLIGIVMFALFVHIFCFQILKDDGNRLTDLQAHIKFAIGGRGYSLLYSIIRVLIRVSGSVISVAFLGGAMIVATWLATAKLVSMLLKQVSFFESALIALPLLILTGIYLPAIYPHFYLQQLVTQPYHNITYYGMRLFSVFAMLFFCKIFNNYLNKINVFYWIILALVLAASTSVKPSFLYGFALCLLIFLIIDFFKSGFKAKPLGHIILMGLVVIPSVLIMLSQYVFLYVGKTPGVEPSSSIALVWGAKFVKKGLINTVLKLICSIGFPCLVAFENRKKLSRFDKFCYVMFFVELVIAMMFVETGKRAYHGNFYWGVYSGAYFMFLVAVTNFIKNLIDRKNTGELLKPYPILGCSMLTLHALSSVAYFVAIMTGKNYFI